MINQEIKPHGRKCQVLPNFRDLLLGAREAQSYEFWRMRAQFLLCLQDDWSLVFQSRGRATNSLWRRDWLCSEGDDALLLQLASQFHKLPISFLEVASTVCYRGFLIK